MASNTVLSAQEWGIAKELFAQGWALPSVERSAWLSGLPVAESVRAEVASLLAQDVYAEGVASQNSGFLERVAAVQLLPVPHRIGDRLGSWEIVRSLGSGGMGDVFEAKRVDGTFEGRAAIKILKRGLDSEAVLQRFARERQALARMHHPHIAMLLDAGLSGDNLPYFVMEYVHGRPVHEAMDGLSVESRLEIFLQLADAVAYAHRNLLVHRDLKPGNVLVDVRGQVKLLDFGIAKALDVQDESTVDSVHATIGAQSVYTPTYASPEQIRGEAVSTSTDIYSLGVLLYQLLTGLRPTGRLATTPHEAARSVLEEEPTKPSRLSPDLVNDPHWVSTRKLLQGDLDNILLMALEKSAERRYASVEAFASDVRNYLSGYPVRARTWTLGYVLYKFAARHRWSVSMGLCALTALFVTTAVAVWQARLADTEKQNAQQHLRDVRMLARTMIFDVNDALQEGITPGRNALMSAATQYLSQRLQARDLSLDDTIDLVDTLRRMADVEGNARMENLGRTQPALERYQQALALLDRVADKGLRDARWWERSAMVRRSQSLLLRVVGDVEASNVSAQVGLESIAKAIALDPQNTRSRRMACNLQLAYADGLYSMDQLPSSGQLKAALEVLRQAVLCAQELQLLQPQESSNATLLSSALVRLARGELISGSVQEGLSLAQRNHALMAEWNTKEPNSPTVARFALIARSLLGYALIHTGHLHEGIQTLEEGSAWAQRQWREDAHNERARRDYVGIGWTLGESLLVQGNGKRALRVCSDLQDLARISNEVEPDQELRLQWDGVERCVAEAWMLQGHSLEALRLVNAFLVRIDGERATRFAQDRQRILQSLGNGHILRARVYQRMGHSLQALTDAKVAIDAADLLRAENAVNMEAWADGAHIRTLAAGLGTVSDRTSRQCRWASEAMQTFKELSRRERLNLEYAKDVQDAQALVAQCGDS